jgi:hypothetical protein
VMDLHLGQPPEQREPGRVLRPGDAADRRIPGGGRQAGRLAGEGRRGLPQVRSQLGGRTARACLDRRLPRVPARVLGRLDAGAAQISRLRSPSALRARCVRTCPRLQPGSSEASRAWPSVSAAAVAARRAVAVWIRWPRLPGSLSIISARPTSRAVPALYCSSFTAILAHGRSRARSPPGMRQAATTLPCAWRRCPRRQAGSCRVRGAVHAEAPRLSDPPDTMTTRPLNPSGPPSRPEN